jgi:hypothetical protein
MTLGAMWVYPFDLSEAAIVPATRKEKGKEKKL